jgi:hypothetical protein
MFTIKIGATRALFTGATAIFLLTSCTQEQQNKISRDIQNWTGTNGVLEMYAGDKLVRRFIKILQLCGRSGREKRASNLRPQQCECCALPLS